ncbi:MAG: hypothetical protein MZV63_49215 [Marinilabiliales bacterium]|nr:hypothetical protein [Marinilabiliales bacterium]
MTCLRRSAKAGGMVQYAIPGFRLTDEAVDRDISRITDLRESTSPYNSRVDTGKASVSTEKGLLLHLSSGHGAQLSVPLEH